jgi:hypothetical protein
MLEIWDIVEVAQEHRYPHIIEVLTATTSKVVFTWINFCLGRFPVVPDTEFLEWRKELLVTAPLYTGHIQV